MESTKRSALLLLAMLALSSSPLALARDKIEPECNSCPASSPPAGGSGVTLPPVTVPSVPLPKLPVPPVSVPSVPLPKLPVPPVSVPPVLGSPVSVPPVVGVPVGLPPVLGVPVGLPPISLPPVLGGSPKSHGGKKACPPPPTPTPTPPTPTPTPPTPTPTPPTPTPTPTPPSSSDKCPIDALKLGACVDVLGNEVHIGDANVKCCPLVKGIAGLSAAACLCTAIKAKVLNLSVFVPIALEVLVNICGCDVPPGYTCA